MSLLDYTFFSETYGAEYELALSAWGEGILNDDALMDFQKPDGILRKFKAKYRRFPRTVSLLVKDSLALGADYGITGIDTAFLEKFETLKELILPDSVEELAVTPGLAQIFKSNKTLVRGTFGSFAEKFALENDLHFRPADFIFAEYEFEPAHQSTRLTLVFRRNGDVDIHEAISEPGTSSSNTFGATYDHPLSRDFYEKRTAEEIAGQFESRLQNAILEDGRLAEFIEKAKSHPYYTGKNA